MTVPGVRVTSVRRTVVVAVALVTGQALLCGVIGFVTFGAKGDAAPRVRATEPLLAGPPIAAPPAPVPPPRTSATPTEQTTDGPTGRSRPAPPRSAAVRSSATRELTPSPVVPVPAVPEPPPTIALLPPPPTGGETPVPVVVKGPCDDEGATGKTVDGKAVRCKRGRDGVLRWRPV